MEEHVFLEENDILVTSTRFVVEDHTYAMNGITSVELTKEEKSMPVILPTVGVILIIYAFIESKKDIIIVTVSILIFALIIWLRQKEVFTIVLHTAAGETEALTHKDNGFIQRVQKALNDAIIFRG